MIDQTLEEMIWRVVSRYAELQRSGAVAMTPSAAYGVLDGLFQQALLGYLTGDQQETLDTPDRPGARPDAAHPQQLKPVSSWPRARCAPAGRARGLRSAGDDRTPRSC